MLVRMELARIIINEIADQYLIYLREVEGERIFPILIGFFEATSINRRFTEEPPPRPLTHDLLKATIEELGGEAQDVVVNNLMEHTYYAVIRVRHEGDLVEICDRPGRPLRPAAADLRRQRRDRRGRVRRGSDAAFRFVRNDKSFTEMIYRFAR
jgi:bifunctional DNase/RNase